ncbi:MAG: autotransporter-associated beta strand repeat-containing protein [Thermoguttaceae bacterium]
MRTHSFILSIVLVISGLTLCENTAFAQLKAFAEAEGYGALVTGGRGGTVYHVTNLNDSGAGSLRDAVSASNRIVVFDTCGVINLSSALAISSNITIAGQTAPGDGITVYGNATSLSNQSNVIIRDMRFHAGINSSSGSKALNVTDGNSMIFDHVSVEWGRWDDIGVTKDKVAAYTVTFQNCIIGEPIDPQYFGGLIENADGITFSHNLFIDNTSRSPKVKGTIQYINNVVYNWAVTGLCGGHSGAVHYLDCIGNTFIAGPSSNNQFVGEFTATDHVYQTGNVKDLNKNGVLDSVAVVPSDFYQSTTYPGPTFSSSSTLTYQPVIPVTIDSAATAYAKVLASAGASLVRDPVDTRLVGQLTSLGTSGNARVHDESVVGGQPTMTVVTRPAGFDSDNDGMPDTWETAHGLNPNLATDRNLTNPVGYTYVEQYINEIAVNHGTQTWQGNTGNWPTTIWWTSAVPTNDDNAYVVGNGSGTSALVTVAQNNAVCFSLYIGGNGSTTADKVSVNAGGALTVNDTIYVGDQNNGTLEINSGGTVWAWNVQLGNTVSGTTYTGNLLLNGGTLKTCAVVLGGGVPGNWTTGGSCTWSGGKIEAIGTLNFAVPTTIGTGGATIDSNGYACTISGVLSGEGGLTKIGSGTLTLTATNTYAGDTIISEGTLKLSSTGQISAASSIYTSSTATFQVDSGTHTVGDISGTGTTYILDGGNLTASSVVQDTLTIGAVTTFTIASLSGGSQSGSSSTTPVPEPSTIALLIAAALGIVIYCKRIQ